MRAVSDDLSFLSTFGSDGTGDRRLPSYRSRFRLAIPSSLKLILFITTP
jgi:hypothetical protein